MNARNRLWRATDAFILVPVNLGFVVSLIGAIRADNTAALIVCLLTTGTFGVATPLLYFIRRWARKVVYVTRDGLAVVWGAKHRPERAVVEAWTLRTTEHWKTCGHRDAQGYYRDGISYRGRIFRPTEVQIREAVALTTAFFKDGKINFIGRMVNGLSFGEDIWIAMKWNPDLSSWDPGYSESVFVHELSHNILRVFEPDIPFTDEAHHPIFASTSLGA